MTTHTLAAAARTPAVARLRRAVAVALDRRRVIAGGERVLVACSGGADSAALLDALARLAPPRRLSLVVAHVDHGLRPESAAEAGHVALLARERGLEMVGLRAVVEPGPALQERARAARHAALRHAAAERGAAVIALGHTADDQAETVLMRALTGATPRALRAMGERDGMIARPLLRVWRAQTQAYCEALGITAVDDPGNRDARFTRSRVRNELLPALETVFPAARRRLVALAEHQRRLVLPGDVAGGPPSVARAAGDNGRARGATRS